MLKLLAAPSSTALKGWDIGFFVACGVIVALIVAIYFLIPVLNKKQYQEQRDSLKKREIAFKTNKGIALDEEAVEANEAAPENVEAPVELAEEPAEKPEEPVKKAKKSSKKTEKSDK